MNVTVNRAEFLAAAKRAASVAPLSSPLEPLRGILLETDRREGCLTISATNLEVSLVQTIHAPPWTPMPWYSMPGF